MRRILVPLDGTGRSATILPDAKRLAGRGGTLILVRDVPPRALDLDRDLNCECTAVEAADQYLVGVAASLRRQGYAVVTQVYVVGGANAAIEEAIRQFQPDMVACATHARSGVRRLLHGSVAWQALSHSPVPMLLRHADSESLPAELDQRHILVPLDGSTLAEAALPLAEQLALEWDAELCLARVVPSVPGVYLAGQAKERSESRAYLEEIPVYLRQGLPGQIRSVKLFVLSGTTTEMLASLVEDRRITDVVMASHGRAGLARVAIGSVADGLIHRLHCPMIVVPAVAARSEEIRRQPAADTALTR